MGTTATYGPYERATRLCIRVLTIAHISYGGPFKTGPYVLAQMVLRNFLNFHYVGSSNLGQLPSTYLTP